jgi:hypothetical protein
MKWISGNVLVFFAPFVVLFFTWQRMTTEGTDHTEKRSSSNPFRVFGVFRGSDSSILTKADGSGHRSGCGITASAVQILHSCRLKPTLRGRQLRRLFTSRSIQPHNAIERKTPARD